MDVGHLFESHYVEESLKLFYLEGFEARLLLHKLAELRDVFKTAEHFGDEKGTRLLEHTICFLQEVGEIRTHQTKTENCNIELFVLKWHCGNVCLDNVISTLSYVETVYFPLMLILL